MVVISLAQNARLNDLIRRRAPRLLGPCPGCGQINWGINDRVWDLEEYRGQITVQGARSVYPVVAIECMTCSFVHFVAAKAAGILNDAGELTLG